ncbi:MAG: glycosyltransferase family 4 protein [Acidobacteriota bacterium]
MKVLHLTDDMALVGGVQRYLAALQTILPGEGVECRVWAPEPGPMDGLASRWYGRRYRNKVRALIREQRPDVVHAHNLWMRLSPIPLQAAWEAGIPVMMTVHDYNWVCPRKWMITEEDRPCEAGFGPWCAISLCRGSHEGLTWAPYNVLRWLKTSWHRRMLVRWVDRFVSPSEHLAKWMERSLGVSEVLHIPNFAPGPQKGSVDPVEHPKTLLFAGRLSREKGVDVLLRAMPLVVSKHSGARLVIAGDGPERKKLERLAVDLGLDAVVRFAGALGPEALGQQYVDAGLVVLPTLWMENCPVSVLEAFAHGRAVVATRIGGVPELVEDGRTGFGFERGNYRELGTRLLELQADPVRIKTMGRNAQSSWAARYTPEVHGKRLRAAYDAVTSGTG